MKALLHNKSFEPTFINLLLRIFIPTRGFVCNDAEGVYLLFG